MVDGSEGTEVDGAAVEPSGAAAGAPRRRTVALWGVLAVFALGAGVLVVRSGDGAAPRLPIALGSAPVGAGAGTRAAAPALPSGASTAVAVPTTTAPGTAVPDIAFAPSMTYVAGPDLPVLGGTGTAYRLRGNADASTVGALARALGLSGRPSSVEGGGWRLETDHGVLEVSGGDAVSWWFSTTPASAGGGVSAGSSGSGSAASDGVVASPAGRDCASGAPTTTVDTSGACSSIAPAPPVRTAPPTPVPLAPDLPSKDAARTIALDLLTRTGMDVRGARVTVDGPGEAWYVSVEPVVGGQPAQGITATVAVGSKGVVSSASGFLARPERFGDYPEMDTRAAIDRLNARPEVTPAMDDRAVTTTVLGTAPAPASTPASGSTASRGVARCVPPPSQPGVATPDHCVVEPGTPPDQPVQPLPPQPVPPGPVAPMKVVLHQAERVLILVPASDGSRDAFLVPGYRFTGDGGVVVEQVAVEDASLVPAAPRPIPMPAPAPAPMPMPNPGPAVGDAKPQQ